MITIILQTQDPCPEVYLNIYDQKLNLLKKIQSNEVKLVKMKNISQDGSEIVIYTTNTHTFFLGDNLSEGQ